MENSNLIPLLTRPTTYTAVSLEDDTPITSEIHVLPLHSEFEQEENQWSPAALERAGTALKLLNRIAKRPPANLHFEDISLIVKDRKGTKRILNSVSGDFRAGELTCILGPSGAGKSSLLNVLAGYTTSKVSGRILLNGYNRDMHVFKKLSCYIMQDDFLQPHLTVLESMEVAANLKLGDELSPKDKANIITEILMTLGLWEHRNTMSEHLSGGQLKRVSVALELVNNPPVIFLDEPTTGLDVVSVRQLIMLLRLLSRQGRTIICTVHQPSALLFDLFDNVYVIANGMCCYQGNAKLLVPYMAELNYTCPTNHNPADFILEALGEEDSCTAMMEHCQNGKLSRLNHQRSQVVDSGESVRKLYGEHVEKIQLQNVAFPTSFLTQFWILLKRLLLQNKRNLVKLFIQLLHHLLCALLVGTTFYAVGNDGSKPVVNFKFSLCCVVFFMYTYVMVPVLLCYKCPLLQITLPPPKYSILCHKHPVLSSHLHQVNRLSGWWPSYAAFTDPQYPLVPMEVRMLRREYFNRWYSLKAYYAAVTVSSLPAMVLLGVGFLSICFLMTGQPLEFDRFLMFSFCGLLTGFCSEGLGMLIGSIFSVTNGSIIGPSIVAPLLALCNYGTGFGPKIETFMKYVMSTSYLRYSLSGFTVALLKNRPAMDCKVEFCLYTDTKLILRDVGMQNDYYYAQILALLAFSILHRAMAYFALRYRLTRCSN